MIILITFQIFIKIRPLISQAISLQQISIAQIKGYAKAKEIFAYIKKNRIHTYYLHKINLNVLYHRDKAFSR